MPPPLGDGDAVTLIELIKFGKRVGCCCCDILTVFVRVNTSLGYENIMQVDISFEVNTVLEVKLSRGGWLKIRYSH